MILQAAAAVSALGLVLFVAGFALERPELAMLGAVVVIGVGGTGVVQGFEVRDGYVSETTIAREEVPHESIGNSTLIQSKDVSGQDSSPTGVDFHENGTAMYVSGASTAAIYRYDTSDNDLSLATFSSSFNVSSEDSTPVGVELNRNGTVMVVVGDATDTLYQYELSEPYNMSTATLTGNLSVSSEDSSPRAVEFNGDGTKLYMVGSSTATIYRYELSTSYDVTTATVDQQFDVSSQEGTPTGLAFNSDGTRLLLTGEETDQVYEYEMPSGYDLSTASYEGEALDVSSEANRPAGVAFEDGGKKLFIAARQNGELHQYDSSTVGETRQTRRQATYRDLETHTDFPLDIVVLLIGSVMLMSSAGAASEEDLGGGGGYP